MLKTIFFFFFPSVLTVPKYTGIYWATGKLNEDKNYEIHVLRIKHIVKYK